MRTRTPQERARTVGTILHTLTAEHGAPNSYAPAEISALCRHLHPTSVGNIMRDMYRLDDVNRVLSPSGWIARYDRTARRIRVSLLSDGTG